MAIWSSRAHDRLYIRYTRRGKHRLTLVLTGLDIPGARRSGWWWFFWLNRKSMAKLGARRVAYTDVHVASYIQVAECITLCDLYIVVWILVYRIGDSWTWLYSLRAPNKLSHNWVHKLILGYHRIFSMLTDRRVGSFSLDLTSKRRFVWRDLLQLLV